MSMEQLVTVTELLVVVGAGSNLILSFPFCINGYLRWPSITRIQCDSKVSRSDVDVCLNAIENAILTLMISLVMHKVMHISNLRAFLRGFLPTSLSPPYFMGSF